MEGESKAVAKKKVSRGKTQRENANGGGEKGDWWT